MLELKRPLVFFDLETTGTNINQDRIIEIALIKRNPDGSQEEKYYKVNPEMPIPAQASAIHGITDKDVEGMPTFKEIAADIRAFIADCDLAGYNSNKFDIPLLCEEFNRIGKPLDTKSTYFVDVAQIFMKMERRTLEAAYAFYCNKKLEGAHSALNDSRATIEILDAQIKRYEELEGNVNFLHAFSKGDDFLDFSRRIKVLDGVPVFAFGKYKDKSVAEIFSKEPQYYDWIMKSDFAQDTKKVVDEIFKDVKLGKFKKS